MDRARPNISIPFENMNRVDRICRRIAEERPDVLPLSPLHAFSFLNIFEDDKALALDRELIEFADELWVFGDWETSEGCRLEIGWARQMGIPIVFDDGSIEGGSE
jgi:hypothetical protein